MTKEQYIQGVTNFGKGQTDFSCRETLEKYPYFLTGRLLSALHNKNEDRTLLAIMHPDRARLSAILQTKKIAVKEKEVAEKPKTATSEKKEEKTDVLKKRLKAIEKKQEDPMQILQKRLSQIEKNKKTEADNDVSEDLEPLFEPEASVSLDELVEKFNNYSPSITPVVDNFDDEYLYRDLGKQSYMEKMNIISETLAEIYISQKLFDKAIKIYQELMLKYPEKNAIFANSIESLRKRIKQE